MPTRIHEFAWPDRVVVGTIGLPGSRTFYLQVRAGAELMSIAMEKQQSAVLAQKIDEILDELMILEGNRFSVPSSTPTELVDNDPLEAVQEQFRTGAMSLGWDPRTAQIVIEAYPLPADDLEETDEAPDGDETEAPEMLRVLIPVGTARAFTMRTFEIVNAGRPICPLCGYPMDADGHSCTFPES